MNAATAAMSNIERRFPDPGYGRQSSSSGKPMWNIDKRHEKKDNVKSNENRAWVVIFSNAKVD